MKAVRNVTGHTGVPFLAIPLPCQSQTCCTLVSNLSVDSFCKKSSVKLLSPIGGFDRHISCSPTFQCHTARAMQWLATVSCYLVNFFWEIFCLMLFNYFSYYFLTHFSCYFVNFFSCYLVNFLGEIFWVMLLNYFSCYFLNHFSLLKNSFYTLQLC